MAEMLLINPRKRRAAPARKRRTTAKRRRNPIQRAAVAAPAAPTRRRRNPISLRAARRVTRRRRRNPIGLGVSAKGIVSKLTDAVIGGAGAVAVDVLMGKLAPMLPPTLRRIPGTVGVGDAVKMGVTILAGELLNKPTRGMSRKAAMGALTVQTADLLKTFLPAGMTLGEFGYASPAYVAPGVPLISPNAGLDAYIDPMTTGGGTPLLAGLGAYTGPGGSPLLADFDSDEYSESGVFRG